jgi:hypothetical protein
MSGEVVRRKFSRAANDATVPDRCYKQPSLRNGRKKAILQPERPARSCRRQSSPPVVVQATNVVRRQAGAAVPNATHLSVSSGVAGLPYLLPVVSARRRPHSPAGAGFAGAAANPGLPQARRAFDASC